MAVAEKLSILASLRSGDWVTIERIRVYSLILIVLWIGSTAIFWVSGEGILDPRGEPIGSDFINPYAAGRMALEGRPAVAYDWTEHGAVEHAISGGNPESYYSWNYPPIFFLAAAPLAMLPYVPALLVWLGTTFALYLAAIRAILSDRLALLAAAAAPTTFITVGHGQNAFLTAGLLGLGLAQLERRPLLAGTLFGCLSYKPHLGLVLPLALAAGGHWRAFAAAAATVLVLCGMSVAIFGFDTWPAFLASMTPTRIVLLEEVNTGWFKIQSLFSTVRGFGGSVPLAYALQGILSVAVLAVLAWMWHRRPGRNAKAALCAGAVLVTPYVLDYDLAVLAPAVAFLVADALKKGFRPYEKTLLVLVFAMPLLARMAADYLYVPLGLAGTLLVFVLAVSRGSVRRDAQPVHNPTPAMQHPVKPSA